MVKYWTRERHRYIVILIPFPALRTKATNARSVDHPESTPGKQFEAAAGSSLQDYTDKHRFSQGELLYSIFHRLSLHPFTWALLLIFHRLIALTDVEAWLQACRISPISSLWMLIRSWNIKRVNREKDIMICFVLMAIEYVFNRII